MSKKRKFGVYFDFEKITWFLRFFVLGESMDKKGVGAMIVKWLNNAGGALMNKFCAIVYV